MLEDKPIVDTSWNLKWKTTFEDYLAELHHLVRTQKKPTQDQLLVMRKMKESWRNWNGDSALWVKNNMTISIPIKPFEMHEDQSGN
jgi:hypothetical protein|tara:strand:- start:69 stop:326 length:258 start_codon:yes stop_codon:yes gene_type:complete